MGDHEVNLQVKYDDFSVKKKTILTSFDRKLGTLGFDGKYFFITLLGFTQLGIKRPPMQFIMIPQVYTLVEKF